MRYPELTEKETQSLDANKCPDCEGLLYEGSHGGGSINWLCGSERCGSRFNYSLYWERVSRPSPMRTDEDSTPVPMGKDFKP